MYFETNYKLSIYYKFKIKQEKKREDNKIFWGVCESPIGSLLIFIENENIKKINFVNNQFNSQKKYNINFLNNSYFYDEKKIHKIRDIIFKTGGKIKIELAGTKFQIKVWENIININYGDTLTYSDISNKINSPKSYRAVANACNSNQIGFLIPCHRLINKNGKLGGYKWGFKKKEEILRFEKNIRKIKNISDNLFYYQKQ